MPAPAEPVDALAAWCAMHHLSVFTQQLRALGAELPEHFTHISSEELKEIATEMKMPILARARFLAKVKELRPRGAEASSQGAGPTLDAAALAVSKKRTAATAELPVPKPKRDPSLCKVQGCGTELGFCDACESFLL